MIQYPDYWLPIKLDCLSLIFNIMMITKTGSPFQAWNTKTCNQIKGSDGGYYPPWIHTVNFFSVFLIFFLSLYFYICFSFCLPLGVFLRLFFVFLFVAIFACVCAFVFSLSFYLSFSIRLCLVWFSCLPGYLLISHSAYLSVCLLSFFWSVCVPACLFCLSFYLSVRMSFFLSVSFDKVNSNFAVLKNNNNRVFIFLGWRFISVCAGALLQHPADVRRGRELLRRRRPQDQRVQVQAGRHHVRLQHRGKQMLLLNRVK